MRLFVLISAIVMNYREHLMIQDLLALLRAPVGLTGWPCASTPASTNSNPNPNPNPKPKPNPNTDQACPFTKVSIRN